MKAIRLATKAGIPGPVKVLGLALLYATGRRVIGVFIDPVMSCNLRCRMCYFSDPEKRKEVHGVISRNKLDNIRKAIFHRALKLQIGCGAEPTLYPDLKSIIRMGVESKIPEISLVTNGQLLGNGKIELRELVNSGLTGLILSIHGIDSETYEYLMNGASWENFRNLTHDIAEIRKTHPQFKLRINFTINSLNYKHLAGDNFFKLWPDNAMPDTIQIRPVQKIGDSEWQDFDMTVIKENYDNTVGNIVNECSKRGITCLAPSLSQLSKVDDRQDAASAEIENFTYCYISPDFCYKPDFDPGKTTIDEWHKQHKTLKRLLKAAFFGNSRLRNRTKKLNYNVK